MLGTTASEGESLANQSSSIFKSLDGCFLAGTLILAGNGAKVPIERMAIGRRVTTACEGEEQPSPDIDPSAFRILHLLYHDPNKGSATRMSFLRPAAQAEGLGAGDTVRLSIGELQLDGRAAVLGVDPCPEIEDGPGRVVTGNISSENPDIRLLRLVGLDKPIEVTASHRIYSEDAQDFVPVGVLSPGELLRTHSGMVKVAAIERKPGVWPVFNLEVDAVHRYYVSEAEVLAHNANQGCPTGANAIADTGAASEELGGDMAAAGKPVLAGEQAAHLVPTNLPSRRSAAVIQAVTDMQRIFDDFFGASMRNREINGFSAIPRHLGSHTDAFFLDAANDMRGAQTEMELLDILDALKKDLESGIY